MLRVITLWLEQTPEVANDLSLIVFKTNLLDFIKFFLSFNLTRVDTYAEIFKEQATSVLIVLVAHNNAEEIVKAVINTPGLMETLGQVLNNDCTSEKSKRNILWVYSNIIAEQDLSFRNAILTRASLIPFLDTLTNSFSNTYSATIPWLICNLFRGGFTFESKAENIVTTCIRLLGVNLKVIEQLKNDNPKKAVESDAAFFEILKTLQVLIKEVTENSLDCDMMTVPL